MTFVLVHGMSHGAWAWEWLRPRLVKDGHGVVTVDLPGHGRRAHERSRASIGAYARAVVVPARIAHLAFLAAVVPRHGQSLRDSFPPVIGQLMRGLARAGGGVVQYPAAIETARWMSDLPPRDPRAVEALVRLTPQLFSPWTERLDLRRFDALDVPRTYIHCLRDMAIPPARAAQYAARLGVTPIDMDCAHNAMMSQPDALATILEKL
jgi:pimeloyl-ACP methyl ester carboxylesterase